MKHLPVYALKDFSKFSEKDAFYANYLKHHIKNHDFTNTPHKHDFFFLVLFTSGTGIHEIDFHSYPVKPGSIFILRPGQMHNWKLSGDSDGYIFFHTRDFYEERFTSESIQDYPFYSSLTTSPAFQLKNKSYLKVKNFLEEITEEYHRFEAQKNKKLHALVNLTYIELARLYPSSNNASKENYLNKLRTFEELIDRDFKKHKLANHYASKMNITEKHLNRISKTCVQKTSTAIISARIILEAKRLLIQSKLSVTQIGDQLGYKDKSYFNRFFKKQTGYTPLEFLEKYKHY